jgi:regulatory protein
MADNPDKTALKKAMALCAGREMCTADIKQKLESWGIEGRDIEQILNKLIHEKFIDEKRYCLAFVKDKFRYNKWGKIKIASALKLKNIPEEIIRNSLESIDKGIYLEVLRDLVTHHSKMIKAKNKFDLKGKLLRFGLSKGFESHLLYDLLNEDE